MDQLIRFRCECGKKLKATRDLIGKKVAAPIAFVLISYLRPTISHPKKGRQYQRQKTFQPNTALR